MTRFTSRPLWMFLTLLFTHTASAGTTGTLFRETAEFVVGKFGNGLAGQTVEEVAEATAKVVARHGDDALPLLRNSGHAGFAALKEAGEKAPDVIKLYIRNGDEAIWLISEPKKLAIFIKHGDAAADALLKHPGIADTLIGRFGDDAVGVLNRISRQSAQRLSIVADEGVLTATKQSPELLATVRRYGDEAVDFIWKNKGSLTVAATLTAFLNDPEPFINGSKDIAVGAIKPIGVEVVRLTNWTPVMIIGVLAVAGLVALRMRPRATKP